MDVQNVRKINMKNQNMKSSMFNWINLIQKTNNNLFRNIAVIGAGLMGAGIAHVSIDQGYNVILRDMLKEKELLCKNEIFS